MTIRPLTRVAGLAAVAASVWGIGGTEAARERRRATSEVQNANATYLDQAMFDTFLYTGNQHVDDTAMALNGIRVQINNTLTAMRIHGEYITRDLIGANLPWLALGAAGLWLGARDTLKGVGKTLGKTLGKPARLLFQGIARQLQRPGLMNAGGQLINRGLMGTTKLLLKNLPATAMVGAGLWYFWNQVSAAMDGSGSRDFFQQEMLEGATGTSASFSFNPFG